MGLMDTLKRISGVAVVNDNDSSTTSTTNNITKEDAISLLEKNGYKITTSKEDHKIQEAISFLESQGIEVQKKEKKEKKQKQEKDKGYESEKEAIISSLKDSTPEEFEIVKDILVIMTKMSELSKK